MAAVAVVVAAGPVAAAVVVVWHGVWSDLGLTVARFLLRRLDHRKHPLVDRDLHTRGKLVGVLRIALHYTISLELGQTEEARVLKVPTSEKERGNEGQRERCWRQWR